MAVFAVFWYTDLSEEKEPFYATADLQQRVGAIKEEGWKVEFCFFLWKAKQSIDSLFNTLFKQYKCTYLEEVSMLKFLFSK